MDTTRPTFFRPRSNRLVAGVATGIAERTGIAVTVVRAGFVVASFFGGLGVLVYLACWFAMPDETADRSMAERWIDELRSSTSTNRTAGIVIMTVGGLIVATAIAPLATPIVVAAVLVAIGYALITGS